MPRSGQRAAGFGGEIAVRTKDEFGRGAMRPAVNVAFGFGYQVIDQADRISFQLKNASALGTIGAMR